MLPGGGMGLFGDSVGYGQSQGGGSAAGSGGGAGTTVSSSGGIPGRRLAAISNSCFAGYSPSTLNWTSVPVVSFSYHVIPSRKGLIAAPTVTGIPPRKVVRTAYGRPSGFSQ